MLNNTLLHWICAHIDLKIDVLSITSDCLFLSRIHTYRQGISVKKNACKSNLDHWITHQLGYKVDNPLYHLSHNLM
jgi:hypothetical protein